MKTHKSKKVTKQEFDRIRKKFPNVQVRTFQASLNKESFYIKWMDGEKAPYDLQHHYVAFFG